MRWLALAALALALPGCVTSEHMPTYVVRFSLANTSDQVLSFDYPHCGKATLHDAYVLVQAPLPNGRGLLVVVPELDWRPDSPGFSTRGNSADVLGLGASEAQVSDGSSRGGAPIVTVQLVGSRLLVDGEARDLPYSTAVRHPEGRWQANVTVERGPTLVKVDHRPTVCK